MKVLAVLILLMGLVVVVVPQLTNCEYGREQPATLNMETSGVAEASVPYRMMKCFWSARAEVVAGVPLVALGALLYFARRKETIRVLGILTALIGVLTLLIPTSLIGTCLNPAMVCNTEMKPTLFVAGGIAVALGIAVLVLGEMRRPADGPAEADAA